MYTFLSIDVTHPQDMNIKDFIETKDPEFETRVGRKLNEIEFDVLLTQDALVKKEAKRMISMKPKLDLLNYKEVITSIADYLHIDDVKDLFLTITSKDVFIDVQLYNTFSYKQLTQLLAGMTLYTTMHNVEIKEVTIAIDNRYMSEFEGLSIDLIVSIYNDQNTNYDDIVIMPVWGHLAQIVKSMKKC